MRNAGGFSIDNLPVCCILSADLKGLKRRQRRGVVSGISLGITETKRRLSTMSDRTRSEQAVSVYSYLVCIDHLRNASRLFGGLCSIVALIVGVFALRSASVEMTVQEAPLVLAVLLIWPAVCGWLSAFLAKKIRYQPRVDHCVTQLRERPFTIFRDALADIEQYDPEVVRMWQRLWGRPKFPPT